jgi:hypothetical protein
MSSSTSARFVVVVVISLVYSLSVPNKSSILIPFFFSLYQFIHAIFVSSQEKNKVDELSRRYY